MGLLEKLIGKTENISKTDIENPFLPDCITSITIRTYKRLFGEGFETYATIEFKKGNTKGEQKIEARNLVEALEKVYEFCKGL